MRYPLWLSLALLSVSWAQETPETPEETPPSLPTRKVRWKTNFYIESAYNQFLGMPADLATTTRGLGSIKLNFQPMQMLRIGNFYIGSSPGLVIREVRFEKNATLYRDTTGFLSYVYDTTITMQGYSGKSKFQLGYLRLPLELGILHKGLQLAVYGYGELLAWARQKRKYTTEDESIKQIQSGNKNFGTNAYQYGIGARMGYRGIGVFASYNLSPLWRSTKGPDNVRPIQVGLYFFNSFYKKSKSPTKQSVFRS